MKQALGMSVVLAGGLALLGCSSAPRGIIEFKLGDVQPGQILKTPMDFTNGFSEPAVLTGLDGACGVRVTNAQNGVLKASQTVRLELVSRASHIPGPGAFKLELTLLAGKLRKSSTCLFSYTVLAHPFLDRSQIWVDAGEEATVHVYGADAEDRIVVSAPTGTTASVRGRAVAFSGCPSDGNPETAHIELDRGGRTVAAFDVDVFARVDLRALRVYPPVVWVSGDRADARIINPEPGLRATVAQSAGVDVRLEGSDLALLRKPGGPGGTFAVRVVDSKGRACSCLAVLPEIQAGAAK